MKLRDLAPLLVLASCPKTQDTGEPPVDGDGDGYFSGDVGGLDCDDDDASVFPGAPEVCDGSDNDCDGSVDEYATDATPWYLDADADGYGDPAISFRDCTVRAGYVDNDGDCDDQASTVHPDAVETCNGRDDDCDGEVDEDACPADTGGTDMGEAAESGDTSED